MIGMAAQEKHIGVLGMQGAVAEHLKMLGELPHVKPFIVRTQQELDEADGLILPGGESTAMTKLLDYFKLRQPLAAKIKQGLPVWGTCAGMILLADRIESAHKDKPILAAMDITVRRNAYGSQLDSFEADVPVPAVKKEGTVPLVFIRAPFVVSAGSDVDILAKVNGNIVAVRQGSMLATAFHPELTDDLSFHRYFADMVQ